MPPDHGSLPGYLSRESEQSLALDRYIQSILRWPSEGWWPPNAAKDVRAILGWLAPEENRCHEVITYLINLALSYKSDREEQESAGHWAENTRQLEALAEQAQTLTTTLEAMDPGARLIWHRAEMGLGIQEPGKGLFPELHLDRMPTLPDFKLVEGEGWICAKPPGLPAETPPDIANPIQELANRLARVLEWSEHHRKTVGRRTVATLMFGPPELELFREAKIGLVKLGLDPKKSYELGCRIHRLVIRPKEKLGEHWGGQAHRRVEIWFNQVSPWIGRETEAPEGIRLLLQQGPQTENLRTHTKRGKPA